MPFIKASRGGRGVGWVGVVDVGVGDLTTKVPDWPLILTEYVLAVDFIMVKVTFWLALPARVTLSVPSMVLSILRVTSQVPDSSPLLVTSTSMVTAEPVVTCPGVIARPLTLKLAGFASGVGDSAVVVVSVSTWGGASGAF